jgi:hypothetical protein
MADRKPGLVEWFTQEFVEEMPDDAREKLAERLHEHVKKLKSALARHGDTATTEQLWEMIVQLVRGCVRYATPRDGTAVLGVMYVLQEAERLSMPDKPESSHNVR